MPKNVQVVNIDKSYKKGLVAVHKLEERLTEANENGQKVSFEASTITRNLKKLNENLKELSLREVLLSDAAGATAKVLSTVWESALPKLIGRECVQVMTGVTPSIRVPTASKGKAYLVGEQGVAPQAPETYSYVEIVARLWEAVPIVSRSMVEDAMWDVIERQYAEAGRAMADAETTEILLGLITDAGGTSAVGTANTVKLLDIAKAIGAIGALDREADTIILHPTDYAQLIQDTAISYVMYFGGNVAQTGIIPRLLGCNVLVSSKQTHTTCTVLDKAHAAVLYVRRDLTVEDYEDPLQDLVGAVVTSRFRYKIIDANAVRTITDCSA